MTQKPLSEELREWIGDVPGAEKLETWAERAAKLEADLEEICTANVGLTDLLRAAEAERDKLAAQVKFLDVHAIREDGNGYTFERIAENARLAAEVNATRAYYANFSVVTDRIAENERMRTVFDALPHGHVRTDTGLHPTQNGSTWEILRRVLDDPSDT